MKHNNNLQATTKTDIETNKEDVNEKMNSGKTKHDRCQKHQNKKRPQNCITGN